MMPVITQKTILAGVEAKEALALCKKLRITKQELTNILGVSVKTLQKKSACENQLLNKNLSERCLNLKALIDLALNYFVKEDAAVAWFHSENRGLGSVTPLSICDTFHGMERVKSTIIKLEYGMTA